MPGPLLSDLDRAVPATSSTGQLLTARYRRQTCNMTFTGFRFCPGTALHLLLRLKPSWHGCRTTWLVLRAHSDKQMLVSSTKQLRTTTAACAAHNTEPQYFDMEAIIDLRSVKTGRCGRPRLQALRKWRGEYCGNLLMDVRPQYHAAHGATEQAVRRTQRTHRNDSE